MISQGDSGGPMVYENRNDFKAYLIGIISFGPVPCGNGKPGIYTKISSWMDWIQDNL